MLQEFIARNVKNCVVATIVDPDVVRSAHKAGVCVLLVQCCCSTWVPRHALRVTMAADADAVYACCRAGVGGHISGMLGGKMDDLHGPSLPFRDARVVFLDDEGHFVCTGPMMTGTHFYMGETAVLLLEGNTVIVSSRPCQAWDQEIIKCCGLDPLSFDYIVLKSAVHFRGHFTDIATHIVEVTGPGIHSSRLSDFNFKNIRRPLYPIDGYFDQQQEAEDAVATSSRL